MKEFHAKDCLELKPQPNPRQAECLRCLAAAARDDQLKVSLGGKPREPEDVVSCDSKGRWKAGRYIGFIRFGEISLTITPRFENALEQWAAHANNVVLLDTRGRHKHGETFVLRLLAALWCRRFEEASRHGLPALHVEATHTGMTIKGRLDIRRTVPLMAAGSPHVISTRHEKSVDHAAARAIVAAHHVLAPHLGRGSSCLLSRRTEGYLQVLAAATGRRPAIPSADGLARIRYTPITASYRPFALLSRQIAAGKGIGSLQDSDEAAHGILIDVAELWELYVLAVIRTAGLPFDVLHGTRGGERVHLLKSVTDPAQRIGRLLPDAILRSGRDAVGVLDAKYKNLASWGPTREDLYQLAAYLWRFGDSAGRRWGGLVYPAEAMEEGAAAEDSGPWTLADQAQVGFITLPADLDRAAAKLREVLSVLAR